MDNAPTRAQIGSVLLVGVLWSLNWPTVKIALGELGPWTLRAGALSLASLALLGLCVLRGQPLRVAREDWWRLGVTGLFATVAPNILVAYAQLVSPTGRTAVLMFTMPIWATILAVFLLGETLDRRRLTGVLFGFAGLLALAAPAFSSGHISAGMILAMAGSLSWAAGTVLTKLFPTRCPALTFAAWQLTIGATFILVGMLVFEGVPVPHRLGTATTIAFAYHAVLGQGLASALWFQVLIKVPASVATLGLLTVPALGVLSAILLLGERPDVTDYIGLVLVTAASGAVLMPARQPRKAMR
jgi:drug/metabolite transporter (DMT)-like permease